MKRTDIDKEIKAKVIEQAAAKFAKVLTAKGYEWAADGMIESVENGYFCCSNASEHSVIKCGEPVSPKTNDWTFYWGIESIGENTYYAWFIERA